MDQGEVKAFLIKLFIVSLVVAVGFFAFAWLMAYLLACGEAAGLGQGVEGMKKCSICGKPALEVVEVCPECCGGQQLTHDR